MSPKDSVSLEPEIHDGVSPQTQQDQEKAAFEKEERRLKLNNLKVDLLVKPLSFVSALIAFSLAYIAFQGHYSQAEKLENERFILEEKISATPTPIDNKRSLLVVDVDLVNKGGNTLRPYAHALVQKPLYKNEGLYMVVYEIPLSPNRLIGDQEGELVYGPHNVLGKYSNGARHWYDSYRIKPHTTYHESEAIILERAKLYQVLVRFFATDGADSGWTITETRYVYVN